VFPGDHFYLNARRDEVLADLSVTLAPLLEVHRFREALA
jgi:surfactin synthase thioesterase subunit